MNQAAIFCGARDPIAGPSHFLGQLLVDLPPKDRMLDVIALKPIIRHLLFRVGGQIIVTACHLLPHFGKLGHRFVSVAERKSSMHRQGTTWLANEQPQNGALKRKGRILCYPSHGNAPFLSQTSDRPEELRPNRTSSSNCEKHGHLLDPALAAVGSRFRKKGYPNRLSRRKRAGLKPRTSSPALPG
jgi:hypothetical protein